MLVKREELKSIKNFSNFRIDLINCWENFAAKVEEKAFRRMIEQS
jgi:predicted transcriptional regulator